MTETESKGTGRQDREYKTRIAETESKGTGKQDREYKTFVQQRLNPKVPANKTENTRHSYGRD